MVHMRASCCGIIFIQAPVFRGISSVLGVVTNNVSLVLGVGALHVSRVVPGFCFVELSSGVFGVVHFIRCTLTLCILIRYADQVHGTD